MKQTETSLKRYLSPRGVEEQYPFSRWTVREWAYTGKITSIKVGGPKGRLLIPVSEIERIIAEGTRSRVVVGVEGHE
jgi:predicted site-specific integrase-resolvase